VGTSMDTNYAFGSNPATIRERYQENHDLIIEAWTNPDVFAWNGKFNKLRYVNVWPRPIQKPHPPIWIPGGGSIETWDFCAEHDYNYSYLSFSGFKRGAQLMNGFHDRVEELGKEFNPYQAAFAQQIIVADSDAEAESGDEGGEHEGVPAGASHREFLSECRARVIAPAVAEVGVRRA